VAHSSARARHGFWQATHLPGLRSACAPVTHPAHSASAAMPSTSAVKATVSGVDISHMAQWALSISSWRCFHCLASNHRLMLASIAASAGRLSASPAAIAVLGNERQRVDGFASPLCARSIAASGNVFQKWSATRLKAGCFRFLTLVQSDIGHRGRRARDASRPAPLAPCGRQPRTGRGRSRPARRAPRRSPRPK
jgi:hypothetical protein